MGMALPIAALAVTAIGTGATVYGQVRAGQAAQDQADYQAAVLRNNEKVAERLAEDARLRGEEEVRRSRFRTEQLKGRQRAVLAGSGVLLDEGSPSDILADTAALGELEALTIRSNAEREALGFEVQGANFEAEARRRERQGEDVRDASLFEAGGTALTGVGTVANRWYGFKRQGAFG